MSAPIALAAVAGVAYWYYVASGHASGRTPAAANVPSAAPSRASHSATPAPAHHGDLRKYLIGAPTGSNPWPQPLGTNDRLSLAQAAKLSNNSKQRLEKLTADHFVQGAVRSWVTEGGSWIDVRLYQLGSAADARNLYITDIDGSSSSTPVADQSPVRGVPGARAFADAKPDSDGFISVMVVAVKGDVVCVIDAAEHAHKASTGTPDTLIREQYGKL